MKALLPCIFEEFNEMLRGECCSSGLTISEDEKKVYIEAAVPGVKSEDIEVTLDQEKRSLKICGRSKLKRENARYHLKSSDRFCYEIPLAGGVDFSRSIEANCKDGILTVELTKHQAPQPLKIVVKGSLPEIPPFEGGSRQAI